MDPHMLRQLAAALKLFRALRTRKVTLITVCLHVSLDIARRLKGETTDRTRKVEIRIVELEMRFENLLSLELLITRVALIQLTVRKVYAIEVTLQLHRVDIALQADVTSELT